MSVGHILVDLGHGLLCAGGLPVFLWVVMALGWAMSVKEQEEHQAELPERPPASQPAPPLHASGSTQRKVIEVVVIERGRRAADRKAR